MITLPTFSNYGDYSSNNYGTHTLRFDIPAVGNKKGITLYYSYDTIVAFAQGGNLCVSENIWGSTTGKHLNWIDGGCKKTRLDHSKFEKELEKALKKA